MLKITLTFCFLFSFMSYAVDDRCYDCGRGGWEKMKHTCGAKVETSSDASDCFKNQKWFPKNIDKSKVYSGYIEVGGAIVKKMKSSKKSFKVFVYQRWAIDENGHLYLLSEIG